MQMSASQNPQKVFLSDFDIFHESDLRAQRQILAKVSARAQIFTLLERHDMNVIPYQMSQEMSVIPYQMSQEMSK